MVPRENNNNAYAKFGRINKSIMVFSKVAYEIRGQNPEVQPKARDLEACNLQLFSLEQSWGF